MKDINVIKGAGRKEKKQSVFPVVQNCAAFILKSVFIWKSRVLNFSTVEFL